MVITCTRNSFSAEDWKSNKNRWKQVNSLMRSKKLIGKSYDEVLQMLGKIDLLHNRKDTAQDFSIEYLTGRTIYIGFERLRINFESGKVVTTEKYDD